MSLAELITGVARDIFDAHTSSWGAGEENLRGLFDDCAAQGWHLLGIPEEQGGAGGDLGDLVALLSAAGEAGVSVPIAEMHAACQAALLTGRELSEDLVAGRVLAGHLLVATGDGDRRGRVLVPWGRYGTGAYVMAPDGTRWLPLNSEDLALTENLAGEPWDISPEVGEPVGDPWQSDQILQTWTLLSCAKTAGAARAASRLATLHASTREQFGRPLIKFQAVSALIADIAAGAKLASAALDHALAAVTSGAPHSSTAVSSAKVVCSTIAETAARKTHQVHGAIGITREHELHRYTRRLWAWRDELGSELTHGRRVGAAVAEGGEDFLWSMTSPS